MAYATATEMLAAVGTERLKRMIPDLQADSLVARLDDALLLGAAKIEGSVAHVYATPLDTTTITSSTQKASTDAQLRRVNILLALEYLALGVDKLPDAITKGIAMANAWLDAVSKRSARIPGMTSKSLPIVMAYGDRADDPPNGLEDAIFELWQFAP